MKDRASLHLVKDNAAVVEGVTIQMLVLFHASLNIPAQPSSQNLFAQFHFVFGDGRDLYNSFSECQRTNLILSP